MKRFFANLEYVSLRLVRKFFFTRPMMDRLQAFLPYYQATAGQYDPQGVLAPYWDYLAGQGYDLTGKTVLELGSGSTNGMGRLMVARGAAFCYCYEPLVPLNPQLERRHSLGDATRVQRVTCLDQVPPGSIDFVLSMAVLEHVYDLDGLLQALQPTLAPKACQLHVVDFRDHFFKYPFHFLQFSPFIWHTFLDPGTMPRHRLGDVWESFHRHGFTVQLLKRVVDRQGLDQVKVARVFQGYGREDLATVQGIFWLR